MSYTIAIRNVIADSGLAHLREAHFTQQEEFDKCDAILLRSEKLDAAAIPPSCKAIARAGVGVNNVPVKAMTERGVVVFNTPGANANSVKELVIAGLLLSSRPILTAVGWAKTLTAAHEPMQGIIEKDKKRFIGGEIAGKKLGVIGLGAIGVQVSNAAASLGMEVLGYDPYITVLAAWGLSSSVRRIDKLEQLFRLADYITIHVPLNAETTGMINGEILKHAKKGIAILNFARGELIDTNAMCDALRRKLVRAFVTDFPAAALNDHEAVIVTPHLGASTHEAEKNCATMAAMQLIDFLQNGNIVNAVNFPHCLVERSTPYRITIINRNVPNIVGKITAILAKEGVNIQDFTNRHKDHIAYNIIDTDLPVSATAITEIRSVEDIIAVRALY